MGMDRVETKFNIVSEWVNSAGGYIPPVVKNGVDFLAAEIPVEGLKNLVIRPLQLIASTLKIAGYEDVYPAFKELGADCGIFKCLIGTVEIFAKISTMFKKLATPITEKPEFLRRFCIITTSTTTTNDNNNTVNETVYVQNPTPYTPIICVASRISAVAGLLISVGDSINLFKNYHSIYKVVENSTPWIYALAGGYMAALTLYTEGCHAKYIWSYKSNNTNESLDPAEKKYSIFSIAIGSIYLVGSTVGLVGIYYNKQKPEWYSKVQFATTLGSVVAAIAHKYVTRRMTTNVWSKAVNWDDKPKTQ